MDSAERTLVLADDHTMMRVALADSLRSHGFRIVAEASDGGQAVAMTMRHRPDIVLMDVSMPTVDGIEATRTIVEADARLRVVILTMHHEASVLDVALRAGARGYCTKLSTLDELVSIITRVLDGDIAVSADMATTTNAHPLSSQPQILSERELEVMRLVARGLDNNAIGDELFISARTVKNHLASIYDRLEVNDKTNALIRALRLGLVEID